MNLSDAIQQYIADRQARGIRPNTVRAERYTLTLLLADVGNINTTQLRAQHIDRFWSKRTTWGASTKNLGRSHLSTFVKWCQARGHIRRDQNPLEGSRKIRVPPRTHILIPQQEFSTFLAGVDDARTRAICAIGLYLFTRISETAALRWQDVDVHNGTVEVFRPKTQTLDTLPMCAELAEEMQRWRLAYAAKIERALVPGDFLIPALQPGGYRGKPGVKGEWVQITSSQYLPDSMSNPAHSIKKALRLAGYYQPREGGHTLRRSGAVALYNQLTTVGHDRAIRVCQAMLGHAHITTTETYLRLDLDRKVRNDLLAGLPMFPVTEEATVVNLKEVQ